MKVKIMTLALALVLGGCASGPETAQAPGQPEAQGLQDDTAAAGGTPATTLEDTTSGSGSPDLKIPTRHELGRYLNFYAREFDADCGPHACTVAGIARWEAPPVIRVRKGATNNEIAQVRYAVALINRALPYEAHMRVETGDDRHVTRLEQTQSGEIFMRFVERLPAHFCGPEHAGCASAGDEDLKEYDIQGRNTDWYAGDLDRGLVMIARSWLNEDGTQANHSGSHGVVHTIVHELLHAAGLSGGPVPGASELGHPPDGHRDTVMSYYGDEDWFADHGFLPTLDEATLIALYGPNAVGSTAPEDLYRELGDWANKPASTVSGRTTPVTNTAMVSGTAPRRGDWYIAEWVEVPGRKVRFEYVGTGHLRGCYVDAPRNCQLTEWVDKRTLAQYVWNRTVEAPVRFGVRESNGVLVPWTEGPASSGGVSGRASWTGALVGLTPEHQSIEGTARLDLDFRHSTQIEGQAAFTDIRHERDGRPWSAANEDYDDGRLTYTLHGAGNTFSSDQPEGGDAGEVNGRLYGQDHAGAAGSLERDDLTGAFGTTRDERHTPIRSGMTSAGDPDVHVGFPQYEYNWQAFDPQTDLPDTGADGLRVERPEGARIAIAIEYAPGMAGWLEGPNWMYSRDARERLELARQFIDAAIRTGYKQWARHLAGTHEVKVLAGHQGPWGCGHSAVACYRPDLNAVVLSPGWLTSNYVKLHGSLALGITGGPRYVFSELVYVATHEAALYRLLDYVG